MLRKRIEELQQEKERAEGRLGELDKEMVYRDLTLYTIANYRIQIVKSTK